MVHNQLDIEQANKICQSTFVSHLGIEFFADGEHLAARMPITQNHLQPFGILHGGASLALAETLGSALSLAMVDPEKYSVVGINIQASHIGTATEGWVTAHCKPVHIGTKTHVMDIEITNQEAKKISVCRLTNMILEKG